MRLNQVTVGSSDLVRAERFYTLLGLRLIVRSDQYLRFECPDGDSTFSVDLVTEPPVDEHVVVYLEYLDVGELDAEHARLRGAGVVFDQAPADMPWLWREARLRDPDGHQLCLYRGGANRKHPPWRLPSTR
jgi:catechol 2,3-dioxygenase-like lactoylglutathione lyase family enzyme